MIKRKEYDILIVEDFEPFRKNLVIYLQDKYKIQVVGTYSELEDILNSCFFKIVFLDYNIPQSPELDPAEIGFDSLELIKGKLPDAEVIFVTSTHKDIETAVEAIKRGASNYIEKERLSREKLFNTIRDSMEKYETTKHTLRLPDRIEYLAKGDVFLKTREIFNVNQYKNEVDTRLAVIDDLLTDYKVPTYIKIPSKEMKRSAFLRVYIESLGNMEEVKKETKLSHKAAYEHFNDTEKLIGEGLEKFGWNYEELANYWDVPLNSLKEAFSKDRVKKIPRTYFLSFCWNDSAAADEIEYFLTKKGKKVLRYEKNVKIDQDTSAAIEKMIEQADTFISLWSDSYTKISICTNEIEIAKKCQENGRKPKRIAIIMLDDIKPLVPFNNYIYRIGKDREQRELAIQRILDEEKQK